MPKFEVSRSVQIAARPDAVHPLIDNFANWVEWSPWEGLDPALQRSYTGAEHGVGARYGWSGNRKAGVGTMEITSSTPERIGLTVEFVRPFKASNQIAFELAEVLAGTEVTWRMSGETTGFAGIFSRIVPMDKLVGGDFEKGLAQLKACAEA